MSNNYRAIFVSLISSALSQFSFAQDLSTYPNDTRVWLIDTCPRSFGPSMQADCLRRNISGLDRLPNISQLPPSDQAWLLDSCPRSFGPSMQADCLTRNIRGLNRVPDISDLSSSDQAWLQDSCPESFGPSMQADCLKRNIRGLNRLPRIDHLPHLERSWLDETCPTSFGPSMRADCLRRNQKELAVSEPAPSPSDQVRRPSAITQIEKYSRVYEPELITTIQQGLFNLGYFDSEIDGIWGPNTQSAISAFEDELEIEVSGLPSTDLIILIGAALALTDEGQMPSHENHESDSMISTGSGFYVSRDGLLVTNFHVVENCSTIVTSKGGIMELISIDPAVDLALLRASLVPTAYAEISSQHQVELGEDIVVLGYPLSGILGSGLNITSGIVSSLTGLGDDPKFIQVTSPIQPGNSGGPVLNERGEVVGVVVAQLDALKLIEAGGTIPQNVNFAISRKALTTFLTNSNIEFSIGQNGENDLRTADIARQSEPFTDVVECR